MGRNLLTVSFVFLLVIFTIGCETKSKDSNSDPKENHIEIATNYDSSEVSDNTLSLENARDLYYSTGISACDEISRDYSFEVIQALSNNEKLVFGNSSVDSSTEDSKADTYRNVVIRDSWLKLHRYLKRNRNSRSAQLWKRIYRRASTLYFEDTKRILGQSHPLLYKNNFNSVKQALREVQMCLDLDSCHNYDFSRKSIYFFKEGPRHSALWNIYYNNSNRKEAKAALRELESLLKKDLNHYVFQKNDGINFDKLNNQIHIDLNLQDMSDLDLDILDRALNVWSNDGFSISYSDSKSGARILKENHIGGRSFYNRTQNTIVLRQGWNYKTLAHEIGHVIGFPDKYYSSFNKIECFYQFEFDTSDIMASSQSGRVKTAHWSIILENY